MARLALPILTGILFTVFASTSSAATLIHEFDFDNGNANDGVGGLSGVLFGDASIADGVLQLDGNGDFVRLNGFAIPQDSSDYSILVRAQQLARTARRFMELISQGSTGGTGIYIGHDPDGNVRLGDALLGETGLAGVQFPDDGAFHNYLMTTSTSSGTTFFIDGILAFSSLSYAAVTNGGDVTQFGRQFGDFEEFFTGNIDYVGIYSGIAPSSTAPPGPAVIPLPASIFLVSFGIAILLGVRRSAVLT